MRSRATLLLPKLTVITEGDNFHLLELELGITPIASKSAEQKGILTCVVFSCWHLAIATAAIMSWKSCLMRLIMKSVWKMDGFGKVFHYKHT